MSRRSIGLDEKLHEYVLAASLREHPSLLELREVTGGLEEAEMQIAPEQGQFMALLVRAIGARRTLEVGVFTGYSTLVVAMALPPGGRVVACDISEEWTSIGRRYWEQAGVQDRIDLRIGPAQKTLAGLIETEGEGAFDFAFIDADKENYDIYYEQCLRLVRRGGIVVMDNVLWSGRVADPNEQDAETKALRGINQKLHSDDRVDISMIPVGDGLTLVRKR